MKPRSNRKSDPASRPAEAARTSGVLARVRQLQGELPPTARRIAAFIDSRAEEVIRMSITELSELTEASEGSIVGLCRRFGASGFQELKILIARDLVEPVQFIQEDLHEGDSPAQVSDRFSHGHRWRPKRRFDGAGGDEPPVGLIPPCFFPPSGPIASPEAWGWMG
jgi:hypothetical protein